MSYEFSDRSQALNLPNPYSTENIFLYLASAALILAGLVVLFQVRGHLQGGVDARGAAALVISVLLLSGGIAWAWRGFSQLNYFVGRGLPRGLAPEIPEGQDGSSKAGLEVRELLRNGAVLFEDPGNNPLYRFMPNLIFAPYAVRGAAHRLAQSGVALLAYIVSMTLALLVFSNPQTASWLGLFYLVLGYVVIFQPMVRGNLTAQSNTLQKAKLSIGLLVLLIVAAVIGPVLLALFQRQLPALPALQINAALLFSAIAAFVATALGLATLWAQMGPPPQSVGSAQTTEVFTMNSHPAKLMEQVDRMLMERWKEAIPNRRYLRQSPEVAGRQGQFRLELVEETQPMPRERTTPSGIGHAMALPQFRWLVLLSAWFALLMGVVAIGAYGLSHALLAGGDLSFWIMLTLGLSVASVYALRSAHALWGRYDFRSAVIWVEVQGSFESARMEMGNVLADRLKTEKDVINIEAMTLRVWASEIDTVLFERTGPRQVLAMRGLPSMAQGMAAELRGFGQERPTLVAPQSSLDAERAAHIGQFNQLIGSSAAPAAALSGAAAQALGLVGSASPAAPPPEMSTAKGRFCPQCGARTAQDGRFCGARGTGLAS
ncbi:MAG: hypothetical protein WCA24_15395 [Thiomonas sp.]